MSHIQSFYWDEFLKWVFYAVSQYLLILLYTFEIINIYVKMWVYFLHDTLFIQVNNINGQYWILTATQYSLLSFILNIVKKTHKNYFP